MRHVPCRNRYLASTPSYTLSSVEGREAHAAQTETRAAFCNVLQERPGLAFLLVILIFS